MKKPNERVVMGEMAPEERAQIPLQTMGGGTVVTENGLPPLCYRGDQLGVKDTPPAESTLFAAWDGPQRKI